MAYDVFISFKSENQETAEKIFDDLTSKGIKCWISSRGIRGGQNYQEEIVKALKDAAIMVLVFSASADKSDEIKKELGLASKYKKHVIPVRIEDFFPGEKYEYELATRQYIDLFKNWEKETDHLAADIKFMMASTAGDGQQVEQQKNVTSVPVDEVTKDNKYLDILTMAYADGVVTSQERDFLARKASELGISSERAKELEGQIKKQRGESNIASTASIVQSEVASDGDVAWPSTGYIFLNAVGKSLDVSRFPFKPTYITGDKEIEEEKSSPEIDWSINDNYYFAVWLTNKRKDKIDVRWGIYSEYEKRDPLFRKTAEELYEVQELLDQDEDISIDGIKYVLNTEDGLRIDASERKIISEINNPEFIKHVVDNLLTFANKAWPVIKKNLVKG